MTQYYCLTANNVCGSSPTHELNYEGSDVYSHKLIYNLTSFGKS